ncbi:MAG TPA: Gfo/Idh/MocA family oxidoreductase [Terriglobia bacterium]|nr:Gfo/Idh/MocA family oxidoreductase [Terriglobia bacterium]
MSLSRLTRRDFNKSAAMTVASLALSAGPAVRNVMGANDRIGVGLIGAGGMGQSNMRDFMRTGQVDIVAIADPYDPNLDNAVSTTLGRAKGYRDFRKVLDHKDVEAVIIATPDHWHAIPMIAACEAGKDVYEEKPLSHTLFEGRKMVEAAVKYNRVVQVGTQQRSGEHFQKAVELVRSGKIGKVTYAETWIHGNQFPEGIDDLPDSDPPPWLDWDLWLGPAPARRYNRNRAIYNFRWFWDYSGGILTDWGTHLLDIVHWAMGVDAPRTIYATGGKFLLHDNRETPDTLEVLYEYPESPVSGKEFVARFSNRVTNAHGPDGHGYGIQFYGTDGTLFIDRSGYTLWPEPARVGPERVPASGAIKGEGSAQHYPHVLNFLECMRSRKKPNSDVETMHRSTSAGLLGVISYKLGRKLVWDAQQEQFPGDAEANKLLTKEYRKPWKVA